MQVVVAAIGVVIAANLYARRGVRGRRSHTDDSRMPEAGHPTGCPASSFVRRTGIAQRRHRVAVAAGHIVMGNPDLGRTRGTPRPCPADRPPAVTGRPHRRPAPAAARWERPALLALLAGTALLYLWNLSASGYANDFYAAAVQAGTQSWKAWLFGSLDSGNAITVDKPPASLWVMVLSARIFGFSSWSLLVPQALMGVASVALLRAAVRRWAGPVAGLLAGAALALTPAAVLMFRFDNPDALLVLLLVAGAYATVRAIDAAVGPRLDVVARRRRRGRRLRVPHQDGPGAAGRAGVRAGLPGGGPDPAAHAAAAAARRARLDDRLGGLVRRAGRAVAGRLAARTSAARRRTRCWSWRWATTAWAASSAGAATAVAAASAAGTAVSAVRPASSGCSPTSWAWRSPGCCRRR